MLVGEHHAVDNSWLAAAVPDHSLPEVNCEQVRIPISLRKRSKISMI